MGVVAFIAAMFAGAIGHELAHWIVWRSLGRDPRLHIRSLYVEPRAGPSIVTVGDRLAAAAPYVIGLLAIVAGVALARPLVWVFGLGFIFNPSRADWRTMKGRGEWRDLSDRPDATGR